MSQLHTQEAERQALCQKCFQRQLNAHKKGLWEFTGTCFVFFFFFCQKQWYTGQLGRASKICFSFVALITCELLVAGKL